MYEQVEQAVDIREYLVVLRARKWTVLFLTALLTTLALVYSFRQDPLYRAESRVLVGPMISGGLSDTPNLETEAQVVASEPVASLVHNDLSSHPIRSLLAGVDVEAITETEVLKIQFTSKDPRLAQDAANSFAERYIGYRRNLVLEQLAAERRVLIERIDAVAQRLTVLAQEIEDALASDDAGLVQTLEVNRTTLSARLASLQQQSDDIQADQSVTQRGGEVIESAALPSAPFTPNHVRDGIIGILFGLILGIGTAFLKDRLHDRFRGQGDLERALGAPVLATIPKFRVSRKRGGLPTTVDPHGRASEAYRRLRTNVQSIAAREGIRTLVVTSPSRGEGKSLTVCNLAVTLAETRTRIILVSSDLRTPTSERHFGLKNGLEGLSTWLGSDESEARLLDLLQDPGIPYLRILPSGPIPANPAELLASPKVDGLVRLLTSNSDIVLFDSPSILAFADTIVLTARVAGTLMVLHASEARRSHSIRARQELRLAGARVMGVALNSVDPISTAYYQHPVEPSYGPAPRGEANGGERHWHPSVPPDRQGKRRAIFTPEDQNDRGL
jgi:capsular exopolysaccharide synthesis family protein